MKTGEKWKRGDLSAIAVVFAGGSVRLFNDIRANDYAYHNPDNAIAAGWVKTHEADGTPVMPEPKPGEVWETCSGCPVWIGSNGTATLPSGVYVTVTSLIFTRRLYPPMEEAK